jgi:malate synthase
MSKISVGGLEILGPFSSEFSEILTPDALEFCSQAGSRRFSDTRAALLKRRQDRQIEIDKGVMPDFLPETASIRQADWKVAPVPADLQDRRVEITGPVDRKMVINALNSGCQVFMADFEDANSHHLGQRYFRADQPEGMPFAGPSNIPLRRANSTG